MAITLDGGIALVTGAVSGIGKETVFALAQAGVEGVILADLNLSGAELVAQESTKKWATNSYFRTTAVQADVSDEAAVNNMVDVAVKEFGRIDYCVHAAGIGSISGATTEHLKVADPIVFLCSPAASYTNEATLIIDSGITLTIPRTSL